MSEATNELYSALARAQARITTIEKDAHNSFHKYDYVSAESMLEECRSALHAEGLCLSPSGTQQTHAVDYEVHLRDKDVPKQYKTLVLTRDFVLVHGKSGQQAVYRWSFPIIPEAGRPLDKAVATALTSGLSYFLRDLLQVPRKIARDDNMDERHDPTPHIENASRKVVEKPAAATPNHKTKLKDALVAWKVDAPDIAGAVHSIRMKLDADKVVIGEAGTDGYSQKQCQTMLNWVLANQQEGKTFAEAMQAA